MPATQLRDQLDDMFAAHFLTREERPEGTLYLAPDPRRLGELRRLLIRFEAWGRHEEEMPEAVDRAIKLLRQRGGDVVIRENRAGVLVVRRGAVKAA
jgi:hypothetical protein